MTHFIDGVEWEKDTKIQQKVTWPFHLVIYYSRERKSLGSYGNSTLFLKRSQYISLDFFVLRKTQKAKCGSKHRAALKCIATVHLKILGGNLHTQADNFWFTVGKYQDLMCIVISVCRIGGQFFENFQVAVSNTSSCQPSALPFTILPNRCLHNKFGLIVALTLGNLEQSINFRYHGTRMLTMEKGHYQRLLFQITANILFCEIDLFFFTIYVHHYFIFCPN